MVVLGPIREWSPIEVEAWVDGLEDGLVDYKSTLSLLRGSELLGLTAPRLDKIGIHKCGHQEAILDSINLLHQTYLDTKGLQGSLRHTAHLLASKCTALQGIQQMHQPLQMPIGHHHGVDPVNANKLSNQHLELVIDVLIAVRQVCFCLQGLSDQLQEDHARFVKLALELSRTALQPLPAWLGIEPITNCCIELCQIADKIQRHHLAENCPAIDTVVIPRDVNQSLGLFLRQRPVDGTLEITGAKDHSAAQGVVRGGDELIAINNQIIVGWSLTNVVGLLKNCGQIAQLSLKRKHLISLNQHSRSQSTPEVNYNGEYDRNSQNLSISRRRSAGPANQKQKPRLSLPPPPNEPYRPKRPHSMEIQNQRAHSLGNLTGSESPNSLMDAAVSAASHGSLQNFSASDNMYLVRVYEEQPATDIGTTDRADRKPPENCGEADWITQEQSLLQQLKSTAVSNSTHSLVKRPPKEPSLNSTPLSLSSIDNAESARTSHNIFSYHSRQGSAASGCTSRTAASGCSGTNSGTNHSTHSNLSETSTESKSEGTAILRA